jgi:sec-independent protein translocase protein TatA
MGDLFAGWHIIVLLLVILVLFGSKKIPDFAKGLGEGIKEFKKATKDAEKELANPVDSSKKPGQEKKKF